MGELWQEIESSHKEENELRLLIAPDGKLNSVPFAKLVLSSGKRFIERYSYAIIPSMDIFERMAENEGEQSSTRNSLLLVGNVDYSWVSASFQSLPGSIEECIRVSSLFPNWNQIRLERKEATPATVLANLTKSKIFHIAAHGLTNSDEIQVFPGALVLSRNEKSSSQMLQDNSYLTSADIQLLDLSNLELAFLNCCNSGKGKLYSEGLLGLGRAFLYAGAKAVVLSLWEVIDSKETCDFVEEFYKYYLKSSDAPEALRLAQIDMMRKGIPEIIWAPYFVMTLISILHNI